MPAFSVTVDYPGTNAFEVGVAAPTVTEAMEKLLDYLEYDRKLDLTLINDLYWRRIDDGHTKRNVA